MTRTRVLVVGLGDTGLLTAMHLARDPALEVVGVSSQPGLVSGQELGVRLARPHEWARDYWLPFDRFRRLDRVRVVRGLAESVDPAARTVAVRTQDGVVPERYDHLVVATGVANGFWRTAAPRSDDDVVAALREPHERLAAASSLAVVGGGAAAVAAAANLAARFPALRVDLYFPGERALPQHHGRTWSTVAARLERLGVGLHPGHRAVLPPDDDLARLGAGPVRFATGQPDADAEVVLWAVGRVVPHTAWLPAAWRDERGFVPVDDHLRLAPPGTAAPDAAAGPDATGVWAIGDLAASPGDPLRSTARNRADRLLAANVRAAVAGRPDLRRYRPAARRWGSVLGVQPDGLQVFTPTGRAFRFPAWTTRTLLQRGIVRRGIYGGVRSDGPSLPF